MPKPTSTPSIKRSPAVNGSGDPRGRVATEWHKPGAGTVWFSKPSPPVSRCWTARGGMQSVMVPPLLPWKHSSGRRPTSYTQEAHRAAKRGRPVALFSTYESSDSENNPKTRHKVGSLSRAVTSRHGTRSLGYVRRALRLDPRSRGSGREHAPGGPLWSVTLCRDGRAAGVSPWAWPSGYRASLFKSPKR